MKITKIAGALNLNFTKAQKNLKVTRQKVKIFNPEQQQDSDKILVIMTKNPALFCSGGLELRNITMDPSRGFVQSVYGQADSEE